MDYKIAQDTTQIKEQPQLTELQALLLQNEELLSEVAVESKYRRNKNIVTPRMSLLINHIERNLIKISKLTPPSSIAEPSHVQKQKQRFLRFYQRRNNAKKIVQSASKTKQT